MKRGIALLIALSLIVAFFAYAAFADEPSKEYTMKLNANEVQIIGNALAGQPYAQVAGLMPKLQQQISEQDKPKELTSAGQKIETQKKYGDSATNSEPKK